MENTAIFTDEYFMGMALNEAIKAYDMGEVPIGAVIVAGNKVIGKGHNLTETLCDVTAHAEIQAITAASSWLGGKYLKDCRLYVTLEPCVMCAGALFWSQISEVIFSAQDPRRGFTQIARPILHPKTRLKSGILAEKSLSMLKKFFQEKRN